MIFTKNICILIIAAITLFSCDLPQSGSATKSRLGLPGSFEAVKTRAADDFLWDTVTSNHHIYTGFTQIGERWLCGRIAKRNGKLWWFNAEGESQEGLINKLYNRELNNEGLMLKKLERDVYIFNEQEYPHMREDIANYYKGLKFVYRGNGELEWHHNNQFIAVFKKAE